MVVTGPGDIHYVELLRRLVGEIFREHPEGVIQAVRDIAEWDGRHHDELGPPSWASKNCPQTSVRSSNSCIAIGRFGALALDEAEAKVDQAMRNLGVSRASGPGSSAPRWLARM